MSNRVTRRARRGLSFVEFVGCIFAVTGGIVVGSMYFGVDVEEAAVSVLQYAELMPASDETSASADASSQPPSDEQQAASDPANSTAGAPGDDASSVSRDAATAKLTAQQRLELTQDYWDALNACIRSEAEHRAVETGDGLNVHNYLSRRREGHRTAAEAIGELKLWGVDGHIAAYAKRVLAWHESGAEMFADARALVTDAPTAQLGGPFADQWKSAVTQHQMEERLLAEKHAAVQAYLDHAAK